LKFTTPQEVKKTLKTRWCQDPTPAEPGDKYEEGPDTPPVLGPESTGTAGSQGESTAENPIFDVPLPEYQPGFDEKAPQSPDVLYDAPPQAAPRAGRKGRKGRKQGGQRAQRRQQE